MVQPLGKLDRTLLGFVRKARFIGADGGHPQSTGVFRFFQSRRSLSLFPKTAPG